MQGHAAYDSTRYRKSQVRFPYRPAKPDNSPMTTPQDAVEKLRALVERAGGPLAFSQHYSTDADDPINPTYVSQILNGHREFRDVARRNMARRAGLPADFFDAVGVNEPEAHYGALDADIAELTLIMRRTDPQTRRDILGAARLLAAQAANPSPSARRHGT